MSSRHRSRAVPVAAMLGLLATVGAPAAPKWTVITEEEAAGITGNGSGVEYGLCAYPAGTECWEAVNCLNDAGPDYESYRQLAARLFQCDNQSPPDPCWAKKLKPVCMKLKFEKVDCAGHLVDITPFGTATACGLVW